MFITHWSLYEHLTEGVMKKILGSLVVLGLSASLIGCASNTQSENTAIGAVSGAVVGGVAGGAITHGNPVGVGVGAVAGALIGGVVGQNMEHSDHVYAYKAVKTGHTVTWVNKKTGTKFTMTPVSGYMTVNGNPHCRKYVITETMTNGHKESSKTIVCRQANGTYTSM